MTVIRRESETGGNVVGPSASTRNDGPRHRSQYSPGSSSGTSPPIRSQTTYGAAPGQGQTDETVSDVTEYKSALLSALEREDALLTRLMHMELGVRWLLSSRGWRILSAVRRSLGRPYTDDAVVDLVRQGGPRFASVRCAVATNHSLIHNAQERLNYPTLRFPRFDEPVVSIVVPTFNLLNLTLGCLQSISTAMTSIPYEVIVSDDGSTDATSAYLQGHVAGVVVASSTENLGFCAAANAGAKLAKGKYLFFLNNDAQLTPGCIDAVVDAASDPGVGAVGCKLVYPDGRLQEAGGVIWSDGTGMNFGRGDDPNKPAYNFRRQVDYCSGAALLVRRDIFAELGGFDMDFSPGYYEDTDLCFKLRARGFRVLFEPQAVVLHIEGRSFGTELDAMSIGRHGKSSQEVNRHLFVAKWGQELLEHYPPGTSGGLLGGRRTDAPRVLICEHMVPTPDRDSGSYRLLWIIYAMLDIGCSVTFFSMTEPVSETYREELQRRGVEVVPGGKFADFARDRVGLYDTVWVSRRDVAEQLAADVRSWFPRARFVYDTVDLHFLREEREEELLRIPRDVAAREQRRLREVRLFRSADVTVAVSRAEAELISQLAPDVPVTVISNIHSAPPIPFRQFNQREGVVFVGGFAHPPNVDGIVWFAREVWPAIRQATDAHLWIVGPAPPPTVRSLESESVAVVGHAPDLRWYLASSRVSVAPLRYGAGVKGKVGQAMAAGLPVVTTAIGAEGMGIVDGEHALVCESSEHFAEAVISVYTDPTLWAKLSQAGRALVETDYSPALAREQVGAIVRMPSSARLTSQPRSARRPPRLGR